MVSVADSITVTKTWVSSCDSDSDESSPSCPAPATPSEASPAPDSGRDSPCSEEPVMSDEELKAIYRELDSEWGRCVGLYVHGSTIFANHVPKDLDLIAIIEEPKKPLVADTPSAQFLFGRCEVSIYTREDFLTKLRAMDLTMLTCLSTPRRFVLKELQDPALVDFELDLDELEDSILSYAIFTWDKCKRVLDESKDNYKGMKNAYFAFRVLNMGCQLADHGRIIDLKASNGKWECIQQLFTELSIQSGQFVVVEAVLGHDFALALADFKRRVDAKRTKAEAEVQLPEATEVACDPCDTCAVCLEPCDEDSDGLSAAAVQLANCRHRFHPVCIAKVLRCRPGHPVCPMCRTPVQVRSEEFATRTSLKRELDSDVGRSAPGRVGRRYVGYPATVRVR